MQASPRVKIEIIPFSKGGHQPASQPANRLGFPTSNLLQSNTEEACTTSHHYSILWRRRWTLRLLAGKKSRFEKLTQLDAEMRAIMNETFLTVLSLDVSSHTWQPAQQRCYHLLLALYIGTLDLWVFGNRRRLRCEGLGLFSPIMINYRCPSVRCLVFFRREAAVRCYAFRSTKLLLLHGCKLVSEV